MAKVAATGTERLEHFANTQNAITDAHSKAITLNESDYVVATGILISYAFKSPLKKARETFRPFPFT